ncbi:PEP/pyruvate-binding domain-containing protein [Kribbella sp. NPDC048915]|uniref:PEP/pyruvate-binding domain-containing protein n=1 Tax=Kribbella sp. NPDC048915 TaxID=3155148 RepID=UPI0033EEEFD2
MNSEYVVRLDDCGAHPADLVGRKASRLSGLIGAGVPVPEGFVVTAAAYRLFVQENRLGPVIAQAIRRFRAGRDLGVATAEIRTAFRDAPVPPALTEAILTAYDELGGEGTDVAVRCSPVESADGEVFLNLRTGADVVAACRRCFASLFSAVAVGNREALGEDHLKAVMPVIVQPMVRADVGASGTARGESTFVRVHAGWGLGEQPAGADQYSVHPGHRPLIVRHHGTKPAKVVYAGPRGTRTVPTTPEEQAADVLTDEDLRQLANWSATADELFQRPMTLHWSKDGVTSHLYILESRPVQTPLRTTLTHQTSVVPQFT